MRKQHSKTRQRYKMAHRELRMCGGSIHDLQPYLRDDEIFDCALLSYDYHDSNFDGWINRQRMKQFLTNRYKHFHLDRFAL